MDDQFYQRSESRSGSHDNLFAWTVAILLLVGVAFACWILSFHVFGHPEQAFSYSILKKLGKLDPPKRFELTTAPRGEFLTANQLYERYSNLPDFELRVRNEDLIRHYLRNFTDRSFKVPYVMGNFNIVESFELTATDRFPSGVIALAQSTENPGVLIEHLYPSAPANVPYLQRMLMTGLDLRLRRTYDLSAVLHIQKLPGNRILLTLVPLLYGSYTLSGDSATFHLEPPQDLNMQADCPVLDPARLEASEKKYAQFRKNAGLPAVAISADNPPAKPVPTPRPVAKATPVPASVVPVATPIPVATPFAVATPVPTPTAATPVPVPKAVAMATPTPVSTPVAAPDGVPLQPFIAAAPQTGPAGTAPAAGSSAKWPMFKPGQVPRGELVDSREAATLADGGRSGERIYLQGQFVVTASDNNKAVLRPRDRSLLGGPGNTRVIVEFPPGGGAPNKGDTVARGELRPFQITGVRRGADGMINVFAREVTEP